MDFSIQRKEHATMFLTMMRWLRPVQSILSSFGEDQILDTMERGVADRWIIASQALSVGMQNSLV